MGGALTGMAALVTGGGGGIGSACALELARDGAAVTIMGRTESTLQAAKERLLGELGDGAVALAGAMQQLAGEAELRAGLAQGGRAAYEASFTEAAVVGRYRAFFDAVAG